MQLLLSHLLLLLLPVPRLKEQRSLRATEGLCRGSVARLSVGTRRGGTRLSSSALTRRCDGRWSAEGERRGSYPQSRGGALSAGGAGAGAANSTPLTINASLRSEQGKKGKGKGWGEGQLRSGATPSMLPRRLWCSAAHFSGANLRRPRRDKLRPEHLLFWGSSSSLSPLRPPPPFQAQIS